MKGDRVVVITGGTRGIGLGLASELLARGARVAICGRTQPAVDGALKRLGSPGRAAGVAADVTREADMEALWDTAIQAFGRVDVWMNNAGVSSPRRPFHETSLDDVRKVLDTNLFGVMTATRVAVRRMLAQGHGQIWNSEGFGSTGQKAPGMSAYGASKRAVTYFTEAVRKDLDKTSIQVNLLSPGIVATDLLLDDYEGQPEQLQKVRKIFNILGDRVETVTPWLAEKVLATDRGGIRVAWLTPRKAALRFATAAFRKRDIFLENPGADRGAA